MAVQIRLVPCLSDNYAVILRDPASEVVVVVDAPEAAPILDTLAAEKWKLTHILVTHKHGDHIQGIPDLKRRYKAKVIGPRKEANEIPTLDEKVGEPDTVELGSLRARVFDTPGHTAGHICFWFEKERLLFAGDTIFAIGCGRAIERPAPVLWQSLLKLRDLPDDTSIYCGHEYTLANGRFAVTVDPANAKLKARLAEIEKTRAANKPTIPSTMAEERATNPFLRADDPAIATAVGMAGADPAAVFTEIRERKNTFRG
ncbi:MAG TPA: hydroxyacylglutathione hydrolase [Xanthobacteraceae bacterium]|jgi:hydroxyacylglutathione hydrolase